MVGAMASRAVGRRGGRRPVWAPKAYLSPSAVILGTGMSQNVSRAWRHTFRIHHVEFEGDVPLWVEFIITAKCSVPKEALVDFEPAAGHRLSIRSSDIPALVGIPIPSFRFSR